MKELEILVAKSHSARQYESTIARAVTDLTQLTEEKKAMQVEMEGLAWELVSSVKNDIKAWDKSDVRAAIHVLRSLGLEAAACALETQS